MSNIYFSTGEDDIPDVNDSLFSEAEIEASLYDGTRDATIPSVLAATLEATQVANRTATMKSLYEATAATIPRY